MLPGAKNVVNLVWWVRCKFCSGPGSVITGVRVRKRDAAHVQPDFMPRAAGLHKVFSALACWADPGCLQCTFGVTAGLPSGYVRRPPHFSTTGL